MKNYLLLLMIVCTNVCFGQLNCKTSKNDQNETVKKCFHRNGKVSTEEIWDSDKRFGSMRAFNNEGAELFFHNLRSVGGHASVQLEYFSNGQLSKVYFSDAPDGGIQYYNSTTRFDESGNQTEFYETKYPNQLEIKEPDLRNTEVVLPKKEEVKPEEFEQEVVECAILFKNYYEIQNATTSKVTIKVIALKNNTVLGQKQVFILEPSQKLVFDTVFTAQIGLQDKIYSLEIVSYTNKRKNKSIKLVEPGPIETTDSRTNYWFVVKE